MVLDYRWREFFYISVAMKNSSRSFEKEWIDLGAEYYTSEEYEDCLNQLDRIGRYLGGDQATYRAFKKLKISPKSILDVGCGGGLFTQRLANLYPQCHVKGIDTSLAAIQFANKQLLSNPCKSANLEFYIPNSARLDHPPRSIDVITSTLVCHHLTDNELILFLQDAYQIADQAIILNDLHRHSLARLAFACVTPLFFRNRLVAHDGQLSIQRAFKYHDWLRLLKAAEIPLECCSITWHWAFRWIVHIDTSNRVNHAS